MSEASKAAAAEKSIPQLCLEIRNLAHYAWNDPENAEYIFTEIEHRAGEIERHYRAAQPPTDPREAFENAMRAIVADDPLDFTPCPNESCGKWFHYLSRTTAWAFEAWKARAAQPETDPNAKCGLCGDIVSNHVCPNRAAQPESLALLREIDKWCSGENQVDDGEDAEDALRYIQDAIKAYLAGMSAQSESTPSTPFGWWDTFNEHLWRTETDAAKAIEGGNNVIALYVGAAQTPGETPTELIGRIRDAIITDQATCAGDYSQAEEYADKIIAQATKDYSGISANIPGAGHVLAKVGHSPETPGETCPACGSTHKPCRIGNGIWNCTNPWHSPALAPQIWPCIFDPAAEGICNKPGHPHHEPAPAPQKEEL